MRGWDVWCLWSQDQVLKGHRWYPSQSQLLDAGRQRWTWYYWSFPNARCCVGQLAWLPANDGVSSTNPTRHDINAQH